MKIKLYQFNLLVLILLVSMISCSKESPLDNEGAVQFVFDGSIDGSNVKYEAGKNNYILNTSFVDGGANDILLMRGEFLNKADTNNILRFEFYGYDEQDNSNLLQNVFQPGNIFSTSTDSVAVVSGNYELQFDALNNPALNHKWNFGGGDIDSGASVSRIYSPNDPVNVTLATFIPQTGCTDSVTNSIDLSDLACQIQFETLLTGINTYSFDADSGYTNYTWLINGVDQMINNKLFTQSFVNPVRHVVELIATNANCTSSWKAVIVPDSLNGCFAGFKYTVLQQPSAILRQRSVANTAVITYITNGKTYRSQKIGSSNQSNRNVFSLASAGAYDNNPAGQRTIRLNGGVDTYLYNVNDQNDSIAIKSSKVSIAVAHP